MTATMMDLDTDILELLDFDLAEPCMQRGMDLEPVCDKAADWKLVTTCCAGKYFFCDEHYRELQWHIKRGISIRCTFCQKVYMVGAEIILSVDRI